MGWKDSPLGNLSLQKPKFLGAVSYKSQERGDFPGGPVQESTLRGSGRGLHPTRGH